MKYFIVIRFLYLTTTLDFILTSVCFADNTYTNLQKRASSPSRHHSRINLNQEGTSRVNPLQQQAHHVVPEAGPDLNRPPPQQQQQQVRHYTPAGIEFRNFHPAMKREGKSVVGTINIGVDGDPNAIHSSPKTTIIEGKKGGKLIETFMRMPSPTRESNQAASIQHLSNANVNDYCVLIGKCKNVVSNVSSRVQLDNKSRIGYVKMNSPGVRTMVNANLINAERSGLKYEKTSIHTISENKNAPNKYPEIQFKPGNQSGQYFSSFYKPDSPPRQSSPPFRVPTNSPQRYAAQTQRTSSPSRPSSTAARTGFLPDLQRGQKRKHGEGQSNSV